MGSTEKYTPCGILDEDSGQFILTLVVLLIKPGILLLIL
ncbi:hypothetical protein RintRC_2198 [Richelia intracellularis]|nr:hypothetical protein RintRC_2198 [Richelia intracellularis]